MSKAMLNIEEYEKMPECEKQKYYGENITEQDAYFFVNALSQALKDDKSMKRAAQKLKKMINGAPVNKNPLGEIPTPQMRLYEVDDNYFLTIDELLNYCRDNSVSTKHLNVLDYYRTFAGRNDVIRKSNSEMSTLYTAIDRYGYGIYNNERSIYCGEFIWEYDYGSIENLYLAFREKGIVFEDDVYAKIVISDEEDKMIFQMCIKNKFLSKNNR